MDDKSKAAAVALARQAYACAMGALAIIDKCPAYLADDSYDVERESMQRALQGVVCDLETFGE